MTKAQDYEKIIRTYMSRLGKKSHEKSPRDPAHFKRMQAASVAARLKKKLKKQMTDTKEPPISYPQLMAKQACVR